MKQGEPREVVCSSCGKAFTAQSNRAVLCPDCRKAVYRAREMAKRKARAAALQERRKEREEAQKREDAQKRAECAWQAIAEVQAKAAQAGLSYGQYVARLEEGEHAGR